MTKQFLILISGHNASGKTVLSRKLLREFDLNKVNGDDVRDFLISSIKFYSDAHYSYPNSKIISANKTVSAFRMALVKELLSQGESVLVDGAGIERKARKKYLDLAEIASVK
ncbi:MAG: AAA family ATPase [Candidatus Diapherotrites archaeon]|nr:AAA family ATPase [Candidatus Diapherotrites archaeon]